MSGGISGRLRRALPRPTRRRVVAGGAVLVILVALVGWAVWPTPRSYTTSDAMLTVSTGPDGGSSVTLDTRYYLPKSAGPGHPVPAVLLAHGFGGTKDSVSDDAEDLANLGYAVMTWTAEGFGDSTGQIHLDSPDWEVRDGQQLLNWLAGRPEIRLDAPGDPRVAVVGGSYGGALALLLAGYDQRVDAIVPQITWNDLGRAFLPSATGAQPVDGVFKKAWAGRFFGESASPGDDPTCGRFAARRVPGVPVDRADRPGQPGGRGAAETFEPGHRTGPDHRADLPDPGRGGLAVPAVRGRRQRPGHRGARHTGEGRLVHRRPRRRRGPGQRPGPAALPGGAVARPLPAATPGRRRRRRSPIRGSAASTPTPTGTWRSGTRWTTTRESPATRPPASS